MYFPRNIYTINVGITDRLHPLYALASAVLAPEIIRRHADELAADAEAAVEEAEEETAKEAAESTSEE